MNFCIESFYYINSRNVYWLKIETELYCNKIAWKIPFILRIRRDETLSNLGKMKIPQIQSTSWKKTFFKNLFFRYHTLIAQNNLLTYFVLVGLNTDRGRVTIRKLGVVSFYSAIIFPVCVFCCSRWKPNYLLLSKRQRYIWQYFYMKPRVVISSQSRWASQWFLLN